MKTKNPDPFMSKVAPKTKQKKAEKKPEKNDAFKPCK